jgi:hypothetical protein
MLVHFGRSPVQALGRLMVITLFCLTAVSQRPAIAADEPSIYFGVTSGTAKPVVVTFVFSKPGGYDPIIGFSMAPAADKCNFYRPTEFELPAEYTKSPLYEPGISPAELTPDKFPSFFSVVVPAELVRRGLVTSQEESHPYTACTRQLWEGLLDPSPKHKP